MQPILIDVGLLAVFGLSLFIVGFPFAFADKHDPLRNSAAAFILPIIMVASYFVEPLVTEYTMVSLLVSCLPPIFLAGIWWFSNFTYRFSMLLQIIIAVLFLWLLQLPELYSRMLAWDYFLIAAAMLVSSATAVNLWKGKKSYWLVWSLIAFVCAQISLLIGQPLLNTISVVLSSWLFFQFIFKKLQQQLFSIIQQAEASANQWDRTVRHEVMRRTLEMERLNRRLAESARTDPLTGILNKAAILEEIKLAIEQCRNSSFTLLLFDIDDFKAINDLEGHLAGDNIIRQVARLASSSIRTRDSLGRYGGDEFLILLPNTNLKDARYISKRLLDLVARELPCTLSLGIAVYPIDGQNAEALIDRADKGLYKAKQQGKNSFAYTGYAQQ